MKNVSVAMATYNGQRYIQDQLESIQNQTLCPFELVVCDDGSSDDTLSIIERFSKYCSFPVTVVLNEERLGYRANFMKAAQLCNGKYIAFCDQDDIWMPSKLEITVGEFKRDDVLLVHHNALIIDPQGFGQRRYWDEFSRRDPIVVGPPSMFLSPPGFSIVFRRSLLEFNDLWRQSIDHEGLIFGHDNWVYLVASLLGATTYIDSDLVKYRQHEANVYGFRKTGPFGLPLDLLGKGFLIQIRVRLSKSILWFENQCASSSNRILLLRQLSERVDLSLSKVVLAEAEGYQTLKFSLEQRISMYKALHLSTRVVKLISLYRRGAYDDSNRMAFGKKGLFRDLFLGVLFGPRYR